MKTSLLTSVFLVSILLSISCRKEKVTSDNTENNNNNNDTSNAYGNNTSTCFNSSIELTPWSDLITIDNQVDDLGPINGSVYQMGITTLAARANIDNYSVSSYSSRIHFVYLGHSIKDTALAKGDTMRQIGLKVRTGNPCNVLYIMWKIEDHTDPAFEEGITIGYKTNPGMSDPHQCEEDENPTGYINIATHIQPPISSAKDGLYHSLESNLIPLDTSDGSPGNDFILQVCADAIQVYEGELLNVPDDIDGPSGFRVDNGKFNFYFYTDMDKSSKAWNISYSGQSHWRQARISGVDLSNIKFGDFNGDGKADAFHPSEGKWYVSLGATSDWIEWHTSGLALDNLALGDFNGDGITDVFYTSNGHWYVSLNGTSDWQDWNTSSTILDDMVFGDFNGDGKTDAFKTSGSHWFVSLGANSSWEQWGTSGYTLPDLAFGDFDGDGKTDVFRASAGHWYVSYSGTSSWVELGTSGYTLPDLLFGDFNGDGKTDVFRSSGSNWYVSLGATGPWLQWGISGYTIDKLGVADFDGDGVSDIFTTQ